MPLALEKQARDSVREFGTAIHQNFQVTPLELYRSIIWTWLVAGVKPPAYFEFELFRPERSSSAINFVDESTKLLHVLCRRLPRQQDDAVFEDKGFFADWCHRNKVASPDVLAVFAAGKLVSQLVPWEAGVDYVSKPVDGHSGEGFRRWMWVGRPGQARWISDDGVELDEASLTTAFAAESIRVNRKLIIQRLLRNHPAIDAISNGALSTLRLMTTRGIDEPVRVLLANLRVGCGDSKVDAMDQGGIAIPIDLETGICGPGIRRWDRFPLPKYTAHPDTGNTIEGLAIPFWETVLALGVRGHQRLKSSVPVIGWDVILLADGPALLEANNLPGGQLAQMPGGVALGSTDYARVVTDGLKRVFDIG
jgi:hypothetical protein